MNDCFTQKCGAVLAGRMYVEPPWKRFETFKGRMGGDIPANSEWISLPGQAMASGKDSRTVEG